MMNKYYKIKHYEVIPHDELKEIIKKKTKFQELMVLVLTDLKTNEIIIEEVNNNSFAKLLKGIKTKNKYIQLFKRIITTVEDYIVNKLHITRFANRKGIQSLYLKNIVMMMVTDPESETHKRFKHNAELLAGIADSSGIFGKIHIMDMLNVEDRPTTFLELTGRVEESKKIWNLWIKSKCDDKARTKLHKALENCLMKQLTIKK